MPFRAGSAEELAANAGEYQLLPDDEYLVEIENMEFIPKEQQQATIYGPAQDQYRASLKVISFTDGSPLEDRDGKPVDSFTMKEYINHNKMGMVPQPSKARKFMAAALQQPLAEPIEIENFPDDLIGKQLYVATILKTDAKGGKWTRAQEFRPIKINRQRRSSAQAGKTEGVEEQATQTRNVAVDDDEIQF